MTDKQRADKYQKDSKKLALLMENGFSTTIPFADNYFASCVWSNEYFPAWSVTVYKGNYRDCMCGFSRPEEVVHMSCNENFFPTPKQLKEALEKAVRIKEADTPKA